MYLSVFTLNVWGLKYFGKNRSIRIRELAKVLIDNKYDIVCLQELWCEDDFEHLKNTCKERFKHSHYFNSGMLGSGMCIMSHYPIIDIHYHSFLLNGYLHMLFHGDWFGGKGIGLCCININGLIVNVYTTHLHACYNPSHDKYEKHRILQAFETANFIRLTSVGSDLSILAGDLNSEPNNICYKLIEMGSNMKDCYSMCVTNKIEWTFNHPRNSYKNTKEPIYRIDYIMYKSNENNIVQVEEHRHSLPPRIPGINISYSDHESIEAIFKISSNKKNFKDDLRDDKKESIKDDLFKIIQMSQLKLNEHSTNNLSFVLLLLLGIALGSLTYFKICIFSYCNYIFVMLIFTVILAWIYIFVVNSIEKNCIKGSCTQMKTVFCLNDN